MHRIVTATVVNERSYDPRQTFASSIATIGLPKYFAGSVSAPADDAQLPVLGAWVLHEQTQSAVGQLPPPRERDLTQ